MDVVVGSRGIKTISDVIERWYDTGVSEEYDVL